MTAERTRATRAIAWGWCLALVTTLMPSVASAQDDVVALRFDRRALAAFDAEAIRSSLEAELRETVVLASTAAEGGSTIAVSANAGRVMLTLTRADGSRMQRRTPIPDARDERTATVVILATNMLRDEASELLALLGERTRATNDPEEAATVQPAADPDSAPVPDPDPAPTPVPDPDPDPHPDPDPDPHPDPHPDPDPDPDPAPDPSFLRLGLNGQVSSVDRGAVSPEVVYFTGLELALTPVPFITLGVREIGGGYGRTRRWYVGGAPFVELAWWIDPAFALHASLGIQIQSIQGAGEGGAVGVAPLALAGFRIRPHRIFSFAIETGIRVAVSDSFHTGVELLPAGAAIWTGGASITFHIP